MSKWRGSNIPIDPKIRTVLNAYVAASVNAGPKPIGVPAREELSESVAVEASLATLRQLFPGEHCTDANLLRANQPGFDILLGNRIRIQVKGSSYVEGVQFFLRPDVDGAHMDFDFLICVDMGVTLEKAMEDLAD